ncbi:MULTISPECIES: DUF3592 domain-containing protein [unclassified Caballeronia]|uniref:DUF3592 domain-containing protein n=1 Tax=unclassified Caballeronia TaxID=2646786 RepID=UPI00285B694A|nr:MULTISPECIES: DUF3592 domain-containing protein [unclassified Caballeronia]MDR5741428.1 DUF3592 domain-containing protein [Caballeronia sp. LZ016]MDR5806741.1 DUF3592 domain-containing protein [Caballeronia sp. LZ019]
MFKSLNAIAIGLVLLVMASLNVNSTRQFLQSSVVVPGRVVALNAGGSHPQVEFVTLSGERVSYPQGGLVFGMKVGEAVRVRYAPAAVRHSATLDAFGTVWYAALLLATVGLGFVVAGVVSVLRREANNK